MTDRDEFAKAAMQGLNANDNSANWSASVIADLAFKQADAMLAARGEQDHQTAITRCQLEIAAKAKEIDAIKAEIEVYHPAVCAKYEAEIAALKAELARWKEPLTDEQEFEIWDAYEACGDERHPVKFVDAAIREVRGK